MKITGFMASVVLAGALLLQGCETLKGASKDIENTGGNVTKFANAAMEWDKKVQEKFW